jgi:hypothetical protein
MRASSSQVTLLLFRGVLLSFTACPALSDNVSQHRSCPTTAHLSLDLSPGSSPWFEYSMPLTRLSQLNLTFNSCPSAYTMLLMAVDSAVVEILSRRWTSCRSDVVATMMVTEVCLSVHPYNTRWWRRTSPCRRPFLFLDYYFTALGGDGRPKYFGEIYFCHIEARCAGTTVSTFTARVPRHSYSLSTATASLAFANEFRQHFLPFARLYPTLSLFICPLGCH